MAVSVAGSFASLLPNQRLLQDVFRQRAAEPLQRVDPDLFLVVPKTSDVDKVLLATTVTPFRSMTPIVF